MDLDKYRSSVKKKSTNNENLRSSLKKPHRICAKPINNLLYKVKNDENENGTNSLLKASQKGFHVHRKLFASENLLMIQDTPKFNEIKDIQDVSVKSPKKPINNINEFTFAEPKDNNILKSKRVYRWSTAGIKKKSKTNLFKQSSERRFPCKFWKPKINITGSNTIKEAVDNIYERKLNNKFIGTLQINRDSNKTQLTHLGHRLIRYCKRSIMTATDFKLRRKLLFK